MLDPIKNIVRCSWKYTNCKYVFISTIVVMVPVYYLLSWSKYRGQSSSVNCTLAGTRNYIPEWFANTNETALTRFVRQNGTSAIKNDSFVVPNIVHYIWYTDTPKELQFHHMLSILSAYKNIKPEKILFHVNMNPIGIYWEEVKKIPSLKVIYREPSQCLFGDPLKVPYYETSSSNVDRLRVLYETGGIYLDLDVLVVKSFDELRRYPCTIGLEMADRACGGIIVCSKESFFLTLWINSFLDDYRIRTWAYNTGKVPYNLWRRYPHLVHVEKTKLHRPNYLELKKIYGRQIINWRTKYSIHLWYRVWKQSSMFREEPNMKNIKTWNSTFGQIARSILFGTTKSL